MMNWKWINDQWIDDDFMINDRYRNDDLWFCVLMNDLVCKGVCDIWQKIIQFYDKKCIKVKSMTVLNNDNIKLMINDVND